MIVGQAASVSSTGVRCCCYAKLTKDVAVMRLCEISAKLCFEESSKFRRIYFVSPLLPIYISFVYIGIPVYIFAVPLSPLLPTIDLARRTHSVIIGKYQKSTFIYFLCYWNKISYRTLYTYRWSIVNVVANGSWILENRWTRELVELKAEMMDSLPILFLPGFSTNNAFRECCGESKSGNSDDNNSGRCEETSPTNTIDRNYQRFDLLRAVKRASRERKVLMALDAVIRVHRSTLR
ncbi:uncharacterized protein [Polyergus mexicanus]|uniref:uncharacterized protein n=1 Tax=Polyergus mexicanus TaxID=615972 RepID=UPI0038B4D087